MFDLHLHLDGSLSKEDFLYLAKKENISLGEDFPNNIYVSKDCRSLEEYLLRFELPLTLLQNKENLIYATQSLVSRLAKKDYKYIEIRFAPLLHTSKGLTILEAAKAVNEGVEIAMMEHNEIIANVILCCMRQASPIENFETVEAANSLKGTRVVAIDLAGPELFKPGTYYHDVFLKAKEYGLNITIHAGEAGGNDEIITAIQNGASRIGHGVHLAFDKETIDLVKENNVCFEFCPTSNLQTKSLKTYDDVPIKSFLKANIPFTINSDNLTVSNVEAKEELQTMEKVFNLNKEEVKSILKNSIIYSFATDKEKEKLLLLLK